jgi:hypothetical protein
MNSADNSVVLPPTSEAPAPCRAEAMKWTGFAPASVSAVASLAIVNWCLNLGIAFAREVNPRCGTGAESVYEVLAGLVPLSLMVPYLGWYGARKYGAGVAVARCAAVTAHAAWLTVLLMVNNFHF